MNDVTAAHRTFPFGTRIKVTNLDNQKTVVVRVNDRGPFVDGRIIDLSLGAAKEVGLVQSGTARVRLEVLQWGDGK
jgi:rare lipoprotein A